MEIGTKKITGRVFTRYIGGEAQMIHEGEGLNYRGSLLGANKKKDKFVVRYSWIAKGDQLNATTWTHDPDLPKEVIYPLSACRMGIINLKNGDTQICITCSENGETLTFRLPNSPSRLRLNDVINGESLLSAAA
jgi:hypothetical protein